MYTLLLGQTLNCSQIKQCRYALLGSTVLIDDNNNQISQWKWTTWVYTLAVLNPYIDSKMIVNCRTGALQAFRTCAVKP